MAAVEQIGGRAAAPRAPFWTVTRLRVAAVLVIFALWEVAGASGLFYRGVIPSSALVAKAFAGLLGSADFWFHAGVTGFEVLVAFAIGGLAGAAFGLLLGVNRYTGAVLEPFLHYLAPTPKIVFLPILLILFGVGVGSKISLGAISCFFPMALSVAAGVRQVNPVFLRVSRTFNLTRAQTVRMVYVPALVPPLASGLRIGLGVAIVGCLMSEIKLSRMGLGFSAMEYYRVFDIPSMLAVLIFIFLCAALGNMAIDRFVRLPGPQDRVRRAR
ncbi:MAG: taurine transporter [Hyphomicrobiales bacterium]|nr:taurine transporter [Hyphomicrobiales bacterium]